MPTASKVLRINGVNTGISYDIEDALQLTRVSSNENDDIKTPHNNSGRSNHPSLVSCEKDGLGKDNKEEQFEHNKLAFLRKHSPSAVKYKLRLAASMTNNNPSMDYVAKKDDDGSKEIEASRASHCCQEQAPLEVNRDKMKKKEDKVARDKLTSPEKKIIDCVRNEVGVDKKVDKKANGRERGCGVTLTNQNKWQAQIAYNSKPQYIGTFQSEETARSAVKLARDKLTISDGSTYEGEELKAIIKCVRTEVGVDKKANGREWGCGVTLTNKNKWQAQIAYNSKPQYIGTFQSEETARSAVKLARDKLTTSDGSTYEGEELKAIIKCVRNTFRVDKMEGEKNDGEKNDGERKPCSSCGVHKKKHSFAVGEWNKDGECILCKEQKEDMKPCSSCGVEKKKRSFLGWQWNKAGECILCNKAAEEEKKRKRKEEKRKKKGRKKEKKNLSKGENDKNFLTSREA